MTTARDRYVLVLAGGRGERFWPWSRPERPKQLLPLASDGRSLLRATIDRALHVVPAGRILVITARDLESAVRRECPAGVEVMGEPVARNTAPAIAAAAVRFGEDAVFAVMPSDHLIEPVEAFAADLERAFEVAGREAVLVTFGIPPAGPETNFGYIKVGAAVGTRLHRVARFREKPDRARAEAWLAEGGHVWNAGIFVWRSKVFLDALEATRPDLARPLRELRWDGTPAGFSHSLDAVFPGLDAISVDYAVLEKAPNVLVLEAGFDWDDLGSWSAWARRQPRDPRGNVVRGDVEAIDCEGCVLVAEGGATLAVMGLRDVVVAQTDGGTLVCRLESSDQVRRVTEALRARGRR